MRKARFAFIHDHQDNQGLVVKLTLIKTHSLH
jgi:hypothetical protein